MWLRWLLLAAVVVALSWVVMILLARRVPPEALVEAWPADRRILSRLAPTTATIPDPAA